MATFEESVETFLGHYEELTRSLETDDGFFKEFMALKTQSQRYKEQNTYPADSGLLPYNKKKNRFKDILPFEYTRVSLHPIEGVNGSDYINANYIAGSEGDVTYIAAQGPLPHTANDFWRMMWYHNIEVVIMACREVEMGKPKCDPYWPPLNQSLPFGSIQVTTTSEENVSNDFVIRDLLAECEGEEQHIRQYHYLSWPDHGKPSSADPILQLIEMVHDYRKRLEVPILVHCSAGCGRTGTILGIDIARSMLLSKKVPENFSVSKLVEKMRQQRPAMVQARDQYHYVYMAVAELARRALGQKPTVPPKPPPKPTQNRNGQLYENVARKNSTQSGGEPESSPTDTGRDAIYENMASKQPPPPHRSKSPIPLPTTTETPIAPLRTNASYENVNPRTGNKYEVSNGVSNLTPPTRPKPVTRKPSQDATGDNSLKASPPAPKPRVRSIKSDTPSQQQEPPDNRPLTPVPVDQRPTTPTKPLPQIPSTKPLPEVPLPSVVPRPMPRSSVRQGKSPPSGETPPKTPSPVDNDSLYSTIDMTAIRDKGPIIQVVLDDESGKKVPLDMVEEELEKTSSSSKSTSILDTLLAIVGDIPEDDMEGHISPDLPPPPVPVPYQLSSAEKQTFSSSFLDEIPPEIPRRTVASQELVNEPPQMHSTPTKSTSSEDTNLYEHPTPFSVPLAPKVETSKVTAIGSTLPTSTSTAQSISTIPRGTPVQHSSFRAGGGVGGFLGKLTGKKKDKKRVISADDISGPVGPLVKSSSDGGLSQTSPVKRQDGGGVVERRTIARVSSGSSLQEPANNRYTFEGNIGYGVRIGKPRGPRPEPAQWRVAIPNSIV